MVNLKGIGASKGIAIGRVLVIKEDKLTVEKQTTKSVDEETKRLIEATEQALKELKGLEGYALKNVGKDEAAIFEVHQMMIMDGELTDRAKEIIQDEHTTAEYAIQATANEFSAIFTSMEDIYMQERGKDIEDICGRIINLLIGKKEQSLSDIQEPVILVTKDLLPSDTVQINKKNVLGIITQVGSKMSHSSIIARTMQIPAVVGLAEVFDFIKNNDEIILDGKSGEIFIWPEENIKKQWLAKQKEYKETLESLNKLKGTKSMTKDGIEIKVNANIGSPMDMDAVIENDAEGIGLFRSEFLYMHSQALPSEETQFNAYKDVLEKMGDKPVIIRTLDVGGDKEISYLNIPKEDNPFLGYRGIRICLDQIDLFKTQIRALLRASVYGRLGIMFPMICTLKELKKAQKILKEVKEELTNENIPFSQDIEVGIMVETPAAVMVSDELAKHVDFFSIGTNDLTQYTMAVDRMNPKVEYLYDTHNPSVLKLIEMTVKNARKENIWVGICGEAAGDSALTQAFADMGIDELSVNPGSVLEIRQKIQSIETNTIG